MPISHKKCELTLKQSNNHKSQSQLVPFIFATILATSM